MNGQKAVASPADVWQAFGQRAVPLKPEDMHTCSCPPNDWTVNVRERPRQTG